MNREQVAALTSAGCCSGRLGLSAAGSSIAACCNLHACMHAALSNTILQHWCRRCRPHPHAVLHQRHGCNAVLRADGLRAGAQGTDLWGEFVARREAARRQAKAGEISRPPHRRPQALGVAHAALESHAAGAARELRHRCCCWAALPHEGLAGRGWGRGRRSSDWADWLGGREARWCTRV